MALVELRVEWLDSGAAAIADVAVFVRCTRQADESTKKSFLRLELLCGPRMWRAEVHEKHKPAVLDCSAIEFLAALETAFTLSNGSTSKERFTYKWSAEKAVLTLSERATSGFAMKYASLNFAIVDTAEPSWQELLHDVVVQSKHSHSETTRQRQRIQELEGMLTKKDALLETALTAKQQLEDELFIKFCAILNGKKEEIERLQRELTMATAATSSKTAYKPSAAAKKTRAVPVERKKTVGAKLTKKKTKKQVSEDDSEEEDVDQDSDNESDAEYTGSAEDDEDSPKKRTREAINAYSQLASQVPMSSQVCAAADVLDDLDAIMKTEVELDNELTTSERTTRKRPPPSSAPRLKSPEKKVKTTEEPSKAKATAKAAPKAKPKPATPPPRKPIDSEEEDILDMLS